jgi:hypothetical protein
VTVSVAVVTIHAVVDVATHTAVLIVRFRFRVAIRALEHTVVVWVRMAGGADSVRSSVVHREVCVVESGIEPTGSRMTRGTRRRKARTHVGRIRCPAVVLLVTTVAICRQGRVVIVYVAARTRNTRVRTRQGEARVVVIKSCLGPGRRVVANVALLRKSNGCVVRIVRILKISQVARHACCFRQTVVGVNVALAALQRSVRASKRPTGGRVIERRRRPRGCVMTNLALLREPSRHVTGIVRPLEILQVTTDASRVRDVVVAVDVTLAALHTRMRTS